MPISYGQDAPKTFDEVGSQLQISVYSAGEYGFNDLAFGVDYRRVTIIKCFMKERESLRHQGYTRMKQLFT